MLSGYPEMIRRPIWSDTSRGLGDVNEHDRHENELSGERGWRILSWYRLTSGVRVWYITEAERSSTTMLLSKEH
jgi:hypothetical protein